MGEAGAWAAKRGTDQPRDEHGRWTTAGANAMSRKAKRLSDRVESYVNEKGVMQSRAGPAAPNLSWSRRAWADAAKAASAAADAHRSAAAAHAARKADAPNAVKRAWHERMADEHLEKADAHREEAKDLWDSTRELEREPERRPGATYESAEKLTRNAAARSKVAEKYNDREAHRRAEREHISALAETTSADRNAGRDEESPAADYHRAKASEHAAAATSMSRNPVRAAKGLSALAHIRSETAHFGAGHDSVPDHLRASAALEKVGLLRAAADHLQRADYIGKSSPEVLARASKLYEAAGMKTEALEAAREVFDHRADDHLRGRGSKAAVAEAKAEVSRLRKTKLTRAKGPVAWVSKRGED